MTAPVEIGIATIWDADVLISAASRLREAKAGACPRPQPQGFHLRLLRGIDRRTGGDEYQRIVEAFEKVSGTLIRTNIRQGRREVPEGFHWIERYAAPTDEEDDLPVSSSLLRIGYTEGNSYRNVTLTIDREISSNGWQSNGGFTVSCANTAATVWGLGVHHGTAHHKSGGTQRLADFAKELRRTVERQRLQAKRYVCSARRLLEELS